MNILLIWTVQLRIVSELSVYMLGVGFLPRELLLNSIYCFILSWPLFISILCPKINCLILHNMIILGLWVIDFESVKSSICWISVSSLIDESFIKILDKLFEFGISNGFSSQFIMMNVSEGDDRLTGGKQFKEMLYGGIML